MKRRNLQPVQPNSYWWEADEHGCEYVVLLPDGREYRFSGTLVGPFRDDLRAKKGDEYDAHHD